MPSIEKIADKVRLVSVKTDKYKTGQIYVSMAMPMSGNLAANALLIRLLKRSCREYPDFTLLNRKLDELYGADIGAYVSKIGEAQVLSLTVSFIDDRFALDGESIADSCAELIAGMIFKPNCKNRSFGADALTEEKRLLIQRVESELDNKTVYARERCIAEMCSNELYGKGKFGTVEEINSVKMADVYAAWKNVLETAVFQISVVGSGDTDKIAGLFRKEFSKIERNPAEINTVFVKKGGRFNRIEEPLPINQGKLVIGFRTGTESRDDDRFAVTVMNDLFGGGTYSKLFANVREKMSLAYYCRSLFFPEKGIILVEGGIDTDKEKTVSAAVVNQLNDLRNGKTDPQLLEASKLGLRERYIFSDPVSVISWYLAQVTSENIIEPAEMIEGIEAVTMEQVMDAAKRLSIDTIFMLSAREGENED